MDPAPYSDSERDLPAHEGRRRAVQARRGDMASIHYSVWLADTYFRTDGSPSSGAPLPPPFDTSRTSRDGSSNDGDGAGNSDNSDDGAGGDNTGDSEGGKDAMLSNESKGGGKNGTPFRFKLGAGAASTVLPGLERAVLTMAVGERLTVLVPTDLAYGSKGAGEWGVVVPPYADLVFAVELLEVETFWG